VRPSLVSAPSHGASTLTSRRISNSTANMISSLLTIQGAPDIVHCPTTNLEQSFSNPEQYGGADATASARSLRRRAAGYPDRRGHRPGLHRVGGQPAVVPTGA